VFLILLDHSRPQAKIQIPRNCMIALVAGGGFVPQSLTDSSELVDSTMVRNAEKGHKGKFFIQFSFSFPRFIIRKRFSPPPRSSEKTQAFPGPD